MKRDQMQEKKQEVINWIKAHKRELIAAGISVITVVAIVLCIKNKEQIMQFFSKLKKTVGEPIKEKAITEASKAIEETSLPTVGVTLPNGFLNKLTGERLTPSGLGQETLTSAREINERLVKAGLQWRDPAGDGYWLSETAKDFAHFNTKTTWAGYTYTNIKWDKSVIELIFSPEELSEIESHKRWLQEIQDAYAA